jgi:hypothetical protein
MIGGHPKDIAIEISHFDQVQYSKTASRSVLGSQNDFAWHFQMMAEDAKSKSNLSLSKAELQLSQMPCKPIDYGFPSEAAKELLSTMGKNDT